VGIGLALIDTALTIGDQVTIDIRGRESTATIVEFPFVPSHVR
jgi:aminomethyltransferase